MSNTEAKNCPGCDGAGTVRAVTYGHGPDDYEYDAECTACGGTGSADLADAINALPYQQHTVKPHTAMVSRAAVLEIIKARAALAAQQAPEPHAPTIAAWAMQIPGCDGSADWVEFGPEKPAPVDGVVARALVWADEAGQSSQQAPAAQPSAEPAFARSTEDPITQAWLRGHMVQYLVLGGYDSEWTDYLGATHPDTISKRLAWRLKSTAQPAPAQPVADAAPQPFKPETWPVDADGFVPDLCTVCGAPVRYGSRHSKCAAPVAQQAEPQPDALVAEWPLYRLQNAAFHNGPYGFGTPENDAFAKGAAWMRMHSAAAHPQQPAPRQLDYSALVEAAFSRHGYAQGTARCVAFKHGAEWAISTGTATTAPATEKEQQQ
jgi:hypothetical protein